MAGDTPRIGILGFDGITALDLAGPMETFAMAAQIEAADGTRPPAYEIVVIGRSRAPFTAESGLVMQPHYALVDAPLLDTVIVPGGSGLRRPEALADFVPWLKARAPAARRVASVCTGIYALAEAGLLDGRRVTTHWAFARAVGLQYPKLRVDGDAIFVRDGRFYTSAGVTAGIDLSLALVEEDHGRKLALSVARELVVFLKRPGGQNQYSEPLRFQAKASDRFADLVPWIGGNLDKDLSVETLAARSCLSTRQFSRRFKAELGVTPAEFVEDMRLIEARHRLTQPGHSVEAVALSIGFRSADVFRRAFERHFGSTPTAYRARFDSILRSDDSTAAAARA